MYKAIWKPGESNMALLLNYEQENNIPNTSSPKKHAYHRHYGKTILMRFLIYLFGFEHKLLGHELPSLSY